MNPPATPARSGTARGPVPPRAARRVFLGLAAVDALFIGLSLLRSVLDETAYRGLLAGERFYISHDGGYGEWFQYLKAAFCALLFWRRFAADRRLSMVGWALVFTFILLDDALTLHEGFGNALLARGPLPTVLGLPGPLYVEPLFWLLVGLPLGVPLALGYAREPGTRPLSRRLLWLLGLLFVFGGVVDLLHAALEEDYAANRYAVFVSALLEDGGEMLILSLTVALAFAYGRPRRVLNPVR